MTQEQTAASRSGPTVLKVIDHRASNIDRYGHLGSMPAFTAKGEHSHIPIERIQGEAYDFIGSKTEPREQQNDSVVSLANGRLAITVGQHRMNLIWRKELRNRRTPPRGYPWNYGG
jgi:hypothetical protein